MCSSILILSHTMISLIVLLAILAPLLPTLVYPTEINTFFVEEDLPSLSSEKNVIVTGANIGLGLASVEHLVKAGTANIVIMACRNVTKCETAKAQVLKQYHHQDCKTKLVPMKLDLAHPDTIHEFAHNIKGLKQKLNAMKDVNKDDGANDANTVDDDDNRHTDTYVLPIHVLINNAGVMGVSATPEFNEETNVEQHLSINHLGHVLLAHLLWNNLVAADQARIVSVSSLAGVAYFQAREGWFPPTISSSSSTSDSSIQMKHWWWDSSLYNFLVGFRYYARSKKANLQFAAELHHQYYSSSSPLDNVNISSVASHPGYTLSHLMLRWQWAICPQWLKDLFHVSPMGMSTYEGSQTQIRAAFDVAGVPSGSYVGPKFWLVGKPKVVGNLAETSTHHLPFSRDESRAMWDQTLEVLGIKEFGKP